MNTISYFEIQSSDPKKAAEFYKAIFGWNFVKEPNMPIEYYRMADTKLAGIAGAILQRPVPPPPHAGTNAFTCSVQVADFDATAATIMKSGGQVAMEKFAIPGRCWQGYFLDADENVFGIFEADLKAQ